MLEVRDLNENIKMKNPNGRGAVGVFCFYTKVSKQTKV